jgi:hypothetical protein
MAKRHGTLGQRCAKKDQESTAVLGIKNKKNAVCSRLEFDASSSIGQQKIRKHM